MVETGVETARLHPKIIDAIRKRAAFGFVLSEKYCDACMTDARTHVINSSRLELRVHIINELGFVCLKCRREAGVTW